MVAVRGLGVSPVFPQKHFFLGRHRLQASDQENTQVTSDDSAGFLGKAARFAFGLKRKLTAFY